MAVYLHGHDKGQRVCLKFTLQCYQSTLGTINIQATEKAHLSKHTTFPTFMYNKSSLFATASQSRLDFQSDDTGTCLLRYLWQLLVILVCLTAGLCDKTACLPFSTVFAQRRLYVIAPSFSEWFVFFNRCSVGKCHQNFVEPLWPLFAVLLARFKCCKWSSMNRGNQKPMGLEMYNVCMLYINGYTGQCSAKPGRNSEHRMFNAHTKHGCHVPLDKTISTKGEHCLFWLC